MAEIVNLTRFRKDRARADRRAEADANAAKHGRSKAERAREEADAARARAALDGAKRDGRDAGDDDPADQP